DTTPLRPERLGAERRRTTTLVMAVILGLNALPCGAAPWINDKMAFPVGNLDYNPDYQRVVWWSGQGRCNGEVLNPAKVSVGSDLNFGRGDFTGMSCGGPIEAVTSDGVFAYLAQGGVIWHFALGAPTNTYVLSVPVTISQGYTPTAVARVGDDLFWFETDG